MIKEYGGEMEHHLEDEEAAPADGAPKEETPKEEAPKEKTDEASASSQKMEVDAEGKEASERPVELSEGDKKEAAVANEPVQEESKAPAPAAKTKGPEQMFNVIFNRAALQNYVLKHPEVVDVDDEKIKKEVESIVTTGDLENLTV